VKGNQENSSKMKKVCRNRPTRIDHLGSKKKGGKAWKRDGYKGQRHGWKNPLWVGGVLRREGLRMIKKTTPEKKSSRGRVGGGLAVAASERKIQSTGEGQGSTTSIIVLEIRPIRAGWENKETEAYRGMEPFKNLSLGGTDFPFGSKEKLGKSLTVDAASWGYKGGSVYLKRGGGEPCRADYGEKIVLKEVIAVLGGRS